MLTQDQVEKLKLTMQTAGWREVVMLGVANRANMMLKQLIKNPKDRIDDFKDAADSDLRARIQENEWFLSIWEQECRVAAINQAADELDRQHAETNGTLAP